ncbi:Mamdc2 [Phodopus roborovskii]|uniref:MAM domain-containing protein 2 n=1 Tax=Phodopus roborovskii TaxID=109678 RepID=A0AAU9ZYY5_PHORO|nr:Mamdc2 [Phodopus roborovskii]
MAIWGVICVYTGVLDCPCPSILHRNVIPYPGHYVYVDTSFAKQGEKAMLLSSDLQAEEWNCLRLVYQITAPLDSASDPSQLNLYVRYEDESFDRLLWSTKEPSDSWLIASLDLQNSSKKFKVLIEGVLGQGDTASIALFEIKMTAGYCIECDFEENHLCGFVNRWNPNVNWFVGGGTKKNTHSILPQDHTFRSEQGHYMYVDSVYVKHFQEVAQLISPVTTAPMSGCLSFYYQLQQGNDNVFSLYTRDSTGLYEEIWKVDHPGSSDWNLAEVEFSAPYPMEVIFEVAFNGPKGGYVALDDISFSPVHCQNQTGLPFSAVETSCDFEEDLCNFYQDKEGPGWTRVRVKPNMYRTGDHTTGAGHYLLANTKFTSQPGYIGRLYGPSLPGNMQYCVRFHYAIFGFLKMSDTLAVYVFEENHVVQEKIWSVLESPRGVWMQAEISFKKPMPTKASHMVYGQKAHLSSWPLRGVPGKHCLTFFYHMYGAGTGLLSVYLKTEEESKESLLWRRRGEQSISWLRALVEYSCRTQHQIIFEAVRGVSIRSDIAIDDVKFQAGPCTDVEDITQQSSGYSEDLNEIEY